ncbi:MAG: hypothetical protein NWE89_15855 [Candidatus Bathyarchaeota archaeon]|nr:hypothetical protein [Candidatus Bathyarchaeota archaeon]
MSQPEKTIDLTPNWKSATRMMLVVLESGTESAKAEMREDILRMAGKLDALIDERNKEQS